MVASLLAVGASPAAAAEIKTGEANQASPSHTTKMTACLGAAEDDAGFTDVSEMHAFYGAINCLAHYGITEGKGDGTYDPEATVSSFEMELFMSRAAKLVGADAEDVVGDVMMSDPVTRAEMAVLIANLLVESAHNDVEIGSDGLISIDDNLARTFDHYADARGSQPRSVDASISALYELGVVKGTGDATTFSPSDDVDRGEMAAIITRALAHTNARPAGLTAQADGATIVVSVRADNHDPEVNVLVDAFWVSSERADRAIDDDGECRPLVKPVDDDSDECEIDDDSTGTNNDGQARIYGLPDDLDEEVTVWVWQGEEGDEVDADTELFPLTVGPLTPPVEHEAIKVTEVSPRVPLVKFGQTYNLSAQLQATVDGEDVDVAPEKGGTTYVLVKELYAEEVGLDATTQKPMFASSDNGAAPQRDVDGTATDLALVRRTTEPLKFNDNGLATFSVTADDPDPSPGSRDDYRTVVWRITDTAAEGAKGTKVSREVRDAIVFAEEPSMVTTLRVSATNTYVEAPGSTGSEGNSVRVTVLDQYQRPMNNIAVTLERVTVAAGPPPTQTRLASDSPNANDDFLSKPRHTDSTGTVRVSYKKKGTAETQSLIAVHDPDTGYCDVDHAEYAERDADGPDGDADTEADNCDRSADTGDGSGALTGDALRRSDDVVTPVTQEATVHWYSVSEQVTNGTTAVAVINGSTEDGEIVTQGDGTATEPTLITFDDNDIFQVGRDGDDANETVDDAELRYVTLGDFEEALDEILDPDGDEDGTLQWSGYDHDDSDERTLFILRITDS